MAGQPPDPSCRPGAVRSPSTPGQELPDRALPASSPLPPWRFPALRPPRPDPFLPGVLGPRITWGSRNPNSRAGPGLSRAPLPASDPGGRGGSCLGPLRLGVWVQETRPELPSRKNVGCRPRCQPWLQQSLTARTRSRLVHQGPRGSRHGPPSGSTGLPGVQAPLPSSLLQGPPALSKS